jgi:iron complex transport system substrate-binding protein
MAMLRALLLLVLAVSAPAVAAPQRVASLGLCTDELALLLAKPGQLVSVSFLAHDPEETPLAHRAAGLDSIDGSFASVVTLRPDLVVTGGAVNRFARELAGRIGTPILDLPPPSDLAGLRGNIRRLAAALGTAERGEALIRWMDARLGRAPPRSRDAVFLVAGGLTPAPESLTAEMLSYAGLAQRPVPGSRVTREMLLVDPPDVLIASRYRQGQFSIGEHWLKTVSAKGSVRLGVDGRLWTCPGPLAAADVARLRRELTR